MAISAFTLLFGSINNTITSLQTLTEAKLREVLKISLQEMRRESAYRWLDSSGDPHSSIIRLLHVEFGPGLD